MLVRRILSTMACAAGLFAAAPASAQFFLKAPDLRGEPITGTEPGVLGPALPGATAAELRAAMVWNLRAALNVAALQCDFEPTLMTRDNYNAILKDHHGELDESYSTLGRYFARIHKTKKASSDELDRFGTRVYSSYSTVSGQLSFCRTAGDISHDARFARPGSLGELAKARLRELRSSLAGWGEQFRASRVVALPAHSQIPAFGDSKCWKRDVYQTRKCGPVDRG